MKTSIILIEEVTGNKNILNSLNYEPDKIVYAEDTLNYELGKFYSNRKEEYLELQTIEIPEKLIEEARETIEDISFFRDGKYQLHHILAGGLNDEQ